MKKFISILGILFLLILLAPSKQAGADRGPRGFHRGHAGLRLHGGFLPGLIIGGALGWGLRPYYYPPGYHYSPRYYYPPGYYYPPPPYYYPPPEYYYPPPAQSSPLPPSASQRSGGKMFIYPRQGQTEEKKAEDVDQCHDWAVDQTGFDPSKPPEGAPDAQTIQKSSDYFRAISACLEAQGYTVR
ncbi:MAG: hypothetical protein HY787_05155 [Deltaproteobacteria bacterium]|nr:hypothetical protein [Deltaproteobacteria bacterium]